MANQEADRRRKFTRVGQYLVYLAFRTVEMGIGLIPIEWVARMGRVAGGVAASCMPSYRKLAVRNLQIAFGREKDLAWCEKTAREHFRCLGANFLCGLKLPLMSEAEIVQRVTVEGMEHPQAVAREGKPLLYAICHLSCWELLTQIPSVFGFGQKAASIYQPLKNPFLEAHVKRRREKLGYTLFDRSKGFGGPMKHLREGGGGIGVLVDQHAGDKGVWCPFFDRLASTSNLAALMALRCDTPLLPLGVYDDGLARWRLVCYPPIDSLEPSPTAEGITAMLNIAVEIMIRRKPENWFWVHDRWKTPNPEFLLANYRRGITLPTGFEMSRLQPFSVLVRSPNWLGDACMALPAVRALKSGRPDISITVLAPAKLGEMWQKIPEVSGVILKGPKEKISQVAQRIRSAGPFDAAILLTNSTRSTLEIAWAGVPRRIGFRGSLRAQLLDQIVPEPKADGPPLHHALRYLHIVKHCGGEGGSGWITVPAPPTYGAAWRIGVVAGAEYGPAKRWPLERFAETIQKVAHNMPAAEWLLFGGPGERAMGEQLSASLEQVRHQNLVGQTTLSQLIDQIRTCRLVLTNDTGTMHLSAALGIPTVSLFGSTEPILTGPLGPKHIVLRHHVPCSPCFRRECPFGHYDCLKGITPERVEAAILGALT